MLSKVTLIGNLGRDPELKTAGDKGNKVCNFSIAVQIGFGDKKETQWWKVAAWNKQAESCAKFLSKGSTVYIDGTPSVRTFKKKTGETDFELNVSASEVRFLSKKEVKQEVVEQEFNPNFTEEVPF